MADLNLEESVLQPRERIIDVKGMSDEKVQKTFEFMKSNDVLLPQYTIVRNGDVVRLTFNSDLGFYEFAMIVNNFVWAEESGQRYEVRGQYPLGTVAENSALAAYSNSDLLVYIPEEEEEPDCVYYKTQDGAAHRYQF